MAGMNLHALIFSFARILRRANRCPFFARRRRLGRGAGSRRHGRETGFRRNGNGIRHRVGLGGRRRPFVWNRRRRGGRHHGHPRQAFAPCRGRGAQAAAVNAQGLHAAPVAPPSPTAPLQPAFHIPAMDWLLGGPAAPFLGEEDDLNADLVPPPPGIFLDNGMDDAGVAFCPEHGYGPCPARRGIAFCPMQGYGASPPQSAVIFNPPSPTPSAELEEYEFPPGLGPDAYMDLPTPTPTLSDEYPEHFMPPGYDPVPALDSPPPDEEAGAPSLPRHSPSTSTSRPSPRTRTALPLLLRHWFLTSTSSPTTRRLALPSLPPHSPSTSKSRSSLRTRSRWMRPQPHLRLRQRSRLSPQRRHPKLAASCADSRRPWLPASPASVLAHGTPPPLVSPTSQSAARVPLDAARPSVDEAFVCVTHGIGDEMELCRSPLLIHSIGQASPF
ncbi:hypothetical protein D1007_25200 [Hordeum vulgare]|nr:hypothetical protein D1007_25200 [Hordeum vulgare]